MMTVDKCSWCGCRASTPGRWLCGSFDQPDDEPVQSVACQIRTLSAEVARLEGERLKLERQLTLAEVAYLNTDAGLEEDE